MWHIFKFCERGEEKQFCMWIAIKHTNACYIQERIFATLWNMIYVTHVYTHKFTLNIIIGTHYKIKYYIYTQMFKLY